MGHPRVSQRRELSVIDSRISPIDWIIVRCLVTQISIYLRFVTFRPQDTPFILNTQYKQTRPKFHLWLQIELFLVIRNFTTRMNEIVAYNLHFNGEYTFERDKYTT